MHFVYFFGILKFELGLAGTVRLSSDGEECHLVPFGYIT